MAHRLEFRLFPSLVFAVSENIMVDPESFSPDNLNPAFIYHNWYDRGYFNALAQLELDYVPARGWHLYAEAAVDQIQAFWEDQSESGAWGVLGGLEHSRFAGPGLLTLSLEGAYTTPLLYRRDGVDFITARAVKVNGAKDNLVFDYTGYPYGGDALVLQLDSRYRFSGKASVSAGLFGMIHGKMNPFVSHNTEGKNEGLANLPVHTPSGSTEEREFRFGLSVRGDYTLPKKISVFTFSAWGGADFIITKNKLMVSETGTSAEPYKGRGEAIIYHYDGNAADLQFVIGLGAKL
jgi:hypothetical protein